MTQLYPTPSLRHLALKKRLRCREWIPGQPRDAVADFLRSLLASKEGIDIAECPSDWLSALQKNFLIEESDVPLPRPGLPFAFVCGVNFELTYGCNMACNHCLQQSLRPEGAPSWADVKMVEQAIEDAAWIGLVDRGVNLTGGEVMMPRSPVLGLIEKAVSLGLGVRCNTNGWWGQREDFKVGETLFPSYRDLIDHMKGIGLNILVLSLDNRYQQYPELLDQVLSIAVHCEQIGLSYEFVETDAPASLLNRVRREFERQLGHEPRYMNSSPMEAVDLGARQDESDSTLSCERLIQLASSPDCKGHGFDRPAYLHVSPDGALRSCMYAVNADFLGNLGRERLPQILNRASETAASQLFASGQFEPFIREHIAPWSHLYRDIRHPCTAAALIARVACDRDHSSSLDMESLHRRIVTEWNLGKNILGELNHEA